MIRSSLLATLTVAAVSCGSPGLQAEELAPSVARVGGVACGRVTEGSGAVVGEGLVLTNAHVVAGVTEDLTVRTPAGFESDASIVGFDPERDLALLAVEGSPGPALPIGTIGAGDAGAIAAVGVDLGVDLIDFEVLRSIVATGDDIYGEGDVEREALEVAADVASGVSGAVLLNRSAEIVGVVFAESRTRSSTYAVAAAEVAAFLAEVDDGRAVGAGPCL